MFRILLFYLAVQLPPEPVSESQPFADVALNNGKTHSVKKRNPTKIPHELFIKRADEIHTTNEKTDVDIYE